MDTENQLSPLAEKMLVAFHRLTKERQPHPCGGFTTDDIDWQRGTAFTPREDLDAALDELERKGKIRIAGHDENDAIGTCYELVPNDDEVDLVEAEIRRSARLEREALAAKPSAEQLDAAISQLRRSERGQQALRDVVAMLKNGGSGLDLDNWQAVFTLLATARAGSPHAVIDRVKWFRG